MEDRREEGRTGAGDRGEGYGTAGRTGASGSGAGAGAGGGGAAEGGAGGRTHYFDDSARWKRLIRILIVICIVVFALDLVNLLQQAMGWWEFRHKERDWEGLPGFYALYGFLAYTAIVYTAKLLRKGVMRDEDYYER